MFTFGCKLFLYGSNNVQMDSLLSCRASIGNMKRMTTTDVSAVVVVVQPSKVERI